MKKNILTFLMLIVTVTLSAQTVFFEGNLVEAAAKAKLENKFLFVDCFTDWCTWCKVADKTTFASENVGEFMSKRFISVKVDMERGDGVDLGMKYRVFGYPSFLIFSPEGNIVGKMFGYIKDDNEFIRQLKSKTGERRDFQYESHINEGLRFPEFYRASFIDKDVDMDSRRVSPESEVVSKWFLLQTDLRTEQAWAIMSRFDLDPKTETYFLENHKYYRKMYGAEEVDDKIISIADRRFKEVVGKKDESILQPILKVLDVYLLDEQLREENKLNFRIRFAEEVEDWVSYSNLALRAVTLGSIKQHLNQANSFAWTLYLKSDDLRALTIASEWMAEVVEADPNYAFMDTYAALLYKIGNYDEALIVAQKAIKIGLENDEKVLETEELLENIRKALDK